MRFCRRIFRFMREVIIGILSTEDEAGRIVAGARERGAAIISGAREKAREIAEASFGEARLAAELAFAAALEAAAREKAVLLEAAAAEIEESARFWESGRRAAVALVVKKVLGG